MLTVGDWWVGDEVGVEGGGADVPRQCRALVQDPRVAARSGRVTKSLGGQQHGYVMWAHSALRSTASGYCNVKAPFLFVSSSNTTPSSPKNTRTTDLGLPYSYISWLLLRPAAPYQSITVGSLVSSA